MIKEIIGNVTPRGRYMIAIAVLSFTLYSLSSVGIMVVVLDMLKKIMEAQPIDLLPYWIVLIGLIVFKAICYLFADLSKHFAGFEVVESIREKILLRMKQFSLRFYTRERLGEINTIIHKDVDTLEGIVGHLWSKMFSDFIVAFIIGIGLFVVNWKMGLAMVSFLPVAILLLYLGIKANSKLQKESQNDLADMVSLFVEYAKGIPLLKAFSESQAFQNKLKASMVKFGKSSIKISKSIANYLGRYFFFLELCFALLAAVGAYMVFQNHLFLFDYLLFVIISAEFYKPFISMESHWMYYIKAKDSYKRVLNVLNESVVRKPEIPENLTGFDIVFDGVNFFYEKGEFELNASFTIDQGTLVALVGPSGSGKTTITNLILRFWNPQKGQIRIGGVDTREVDYDDLLSSISIVMQNVILFADTIYENIKIGNKNATREEVVEAAKKAMIHDFIMGLPQGYDTPVGENGVGLSGGQRQRISIARAFLKDAPIVILDEVTSNVDPINEVKIQKAISSLSVNRTVVVIAHHLRTIRNADNIIVLDKGEIVEIGKHHELMKKGKWYKKLWDAQEQAKKWEIGKYDSKRLSVQIHDGYSNSSK